VKELEEDGIGGLRRTLRYFRRLSTRVREKDQGRFTPTMLASAVCVLLIKSFEDVFRREISPRRLKKSGREFEEGKAAVGGTSVKSLGKKIRRGPGQGRRRDDFLQGRDSDGEKVRKCGQGELLERISRHGFFLGCSRYPECDFIQDMSEEIPKTPEKQGCQVLPKTGGKEMALKRGRFGAHFWLHGYPDCQDGRGAWWPGTAELLTSQTNRWTRNAAGRKPGW